MGNGTKGSLSRWSRVPLAAAALAMAAAPDRVLAASVTDAPSIRATPVEVQRVVGDLAHPWGIAFLPDGSFLVTERPGRLTLVPAGATEAVPVDGVPAVYANGQGGLLDVAIDPSFASNRLVYLSYAEEGPGGAGTAVARGTLSIGEGEAALRNVETIFRQTPKVAGGRHFGARLMFAPDGTLFVGLGDRGRDAEAQDAGNTIGTLVRIHPDGRVPSDNPFVGRSGVRPEIWSIGHRNIQGADIDPATGRIVTVEHGARGGDEINVPLAGRNYGWPVISYGRQYSGAPIGEGTAKAGLEQPVYYWDPSIAPSGLVVYDGDLFPGWRGDIVVGALRAQRLVRLAFENGRVTGEEVLLDGAIGRIRDVEVAPDGSLYLLTDDANGSVYRLTPRG